MLPHSRCNSNVWNVLHLRNQYQWNLGGSFKITRAYRSRHWWYVWSSILNKKNIKITLLSIFGGLDVSTMYLANEMKCRKFSKFFFYYGCGHVSSFSTALILAIYDICNGKTDTSAWNLSFNVVLPFDTRSIFGWFLDWLYQFSMVINYAICMILSATHFACFCYYIIATCSQFDLMIDALRFDCEQIQKEKNIRKHMKMRQNAMEQLQQAIDMHSQIYE